MNVIVDQYGKPYSFPETSIGEQYAEAIARSWRDNKVTLTAHMMLGWTGAQHFHWVNTGEEPK